MIRRLAAFVLALMLAAPAAVAQPKPAPKAPQPAPQPAPRLNWAPSWEDALAVAQADDAPILAYVYVTNNPACLAMEQKVFTDKTFRKLSSLFVLARVEATRLPELVQKFGVRTPALVFLDSAGEKVMSLDADLAPKRVLNAMGRTFLISMFTSGKRQAAAGHVRPALRRFRMVQMIGEGTPPAKWAETEITALNAAGIKKLSQAQIAFDAGDLLKCVTLLDELLYEYRGTQTGADAKTLYDKIAQDPKSAEVRQEVERRREASRELALAKKLEARKDVENALITYWDVARDYPKTPAADEACVRAAEISKDDALARRAAEARAKRDCENWLEMAASFEKNRLWDRAAEYYKRVIDNYPDTPYAAKARGGMKALPSPAPAK